MNANSQIAAFFDVDRTLVLGHTGRMYFRHLRERGDVGWLAILRLTSVLIRYKMAAINMNRVMQQAAAEVEGMPEAQMAEVCQEVFNTRVIPRISKAAVEALEGHRKQGHKIVLLTASTPYIVEPLSDYLECDEFLCTRLTVSDGTLTGDYVRPMCYGDGKCHWANQYAQEHNINLSKSYFYTDSYTDLPMLEAVGHKRVVNPDPRLRLCALRNRWPILHFNR